MAPVYLLPSDWHWLRLVARYESCRETFPCQQLTRTRKTSGSILSPSDVNNLVGIKPTVGLTSRYLVIPISERQDTVGPMARTVKDAAYLLQAIAGADSHDNYTSAIPNNGTIPDYLAACDYSAFSGARIGVAWNGIYETAILTKSPP